MRTLYKTLIAFAVVAAIITVIVLALFGVFGQGLTKEQQLGPNAPTGQIVFRAQRKDNNKYQVVLSTKPTSSTYGNYYIMYNPTISSDPNLTVFDTRVAAYQYYWDTAYVASPLNKAYTPLSTTTLDVDYKNID